MSIYTLIYEHVDRYGCTMQARVPVDSSILGSISILQLAKEASAALGTEVTVEDDEGETMYSINAGGRR